MGWSCRAEAGETMQALQRNHNTPGAFCGCFKYRGENYFMDPSSREHADGAITGKVLHMLEQRPDGTGSVEIVGPFRIEPDGRLSRAPVPLRALALWLEAEGKLP